MANLISLLIILFFSLAQVNASVKEISSLHIVYLGHANPNLHPNAIVESHHSLLAQVLESREAVAESLVYTYKHAFSGFAAKLTNDQVDRLSNHPDVISVFPSKTSRLHTTASWDFLGLSPNGLQSAQAWPRSSKTGPSLWKKAHYGRGVIIGSLDTGIWPESQSFSDKYMTPIPKSWRGSCDPGVDFNSSMCNKKLIGAKYYLSGIVRLFSSGDIISARDNEGHGTHTSTTAAGSFVPNVSVLGLGNGMAKGGAPLARIAAYKVCWSAGCNEADILAALDTAVYDGVNVVTMSLGSTGNVDLFEDATAIGSFHAIQRGITVVASAGNAGPELGKVVNVAPWIITVAASTLDRFIGSKVVLGNNATYEGASMCNETNQLPLVSSKDVSLTTSNATDSELCLANSLDPEKVRDKIVVCLRGGNGRIEKGENVLKAGGAGMILYNSDENDNTLLSDRHALPAVHVSYKAGLEILSYLNSTKDATAYFTKAVTTLGHKPDPVMASFSSPGPNSLIPDILKPDITAPGVNIISAITQANGEGPYGIESGTSMSCPHVAGIIALLKAYHPDWSHAAIKSALMTTAYQYDNDKEAILTAGSKKATPFHYGGGHVDPNAAAEPGLIYDTTEADYILMLCGLGYNSSMIQQVTDRVINCPKHSSPVSGLNLPSITLSNLTGTGIVSRTVTNVGNAKSIYRSVIEAPRGVSVSVKPSKLKFHKVGQKITFQVTFNVTCPQNDYVFGWLTWRNHEHNVRIPLTVKAVN